MDAAPRLMLSTPGPAGLAALRSCVVEVQNGDPLAAITVVVPNVIAGMTVRRCFAESGLANVRFETIEQFAQRLSARDMALAGSVPTTRSMRVLAVRAAVHVGAGRLTDAAAAPSTLALLCELFFELDLSEQPVEVVAARLESVGARGKEIAELYADYRDRLADTPDAHLAFDCAAQAVAQGSLDRVILFAPRALAPPARRLLRSLAEHRRLWAIAHVVAESDAESSEVVDWLAVQLGRERRRCESVSLLADMSATAAADVTAVGDATPAKVAAAVGAAANVTAAMDIVVAPDPEEEVRQGIRRILGYLVESSNRPDRVAVAFRQHSPYCRLLSEQLAASGIPFSIPSQDPLAASVVGRAIMGLLALPAREFARADVMRWLRDAPLLTTDGAPVPIVSWDRISREAGISRGALTWAVRLDRHAAKLREQLIRNDASQSPGQIPERPAEQIAQQIELTVGLRDVVGGVIDCVNAIDASTRWRDVAAHLNSMINDRFDFDGTTQRVGQFDGASAAGHALQRGAVIRVQRLINSLELMDTTAAPAPSSRQAAAVLGDELATPMGSSTTLGRGVFVGSVRDLAAGDYDLVIILGMTETAFPSQIRENALLSDITRTALGLGLVTATARKLRDRRDYLTLIQCAPSVVLSSPRADPRTQRAAHPSPWLLQAASARAGAPVTAAQLTSLVEPWLQVSESFVSSLREASVTASVAEHSIKLAMSGKLLSLGEGNARLARAQAAVAARRAGEFGPWTGDVGRALDTATQADQGLSATSMEAWAKCPAQFWFRRKLQVAEFEEIDDGRIDMRERGSLVHQVLEDFIRDHLGSVEAPGRDPDSAWTPTEIRRASELLDEQADALESKGKTGRPLLWRAEKVKLHRKLSQILAVDSRLRARRRSWPVAVELPFGRRGQPPLNLDLPGSGIVSFHGEADRVDMTAAGGLIVTDYKTGKDNKYDRIPKSDQAKPDADLVDRGRNLQLVLYALAAKQALGTPLTPTQAYYWFLEMGELHRGAGVDSAAETRLSEVLDTIVQGIRSGIYPANPGDWDAWRGWDSCQYCPFDRICPTTRGEQYSLVSRDPKVQGYAVLADAGLGGPSSAPRTDPSEVK